MRLITTLLMISCSLAATSQKKAPTKEINWEMQELVRCGNLGNVAVLTDRENFAGQVRFELLNDKNEVIVVEELKLRKMQLAGQYESAFFWNGKFTVLTSLFYPGPKRNHLLLRQYSLPDFEEVHSEIIDEAYTPDRFRIPFGYSLSPDSSKIVFYSWSYALKEGSARIVAKVLDRDLQPLWQDKYILPYDNQKLYVYDCLLDNEGHAYLLCEYYTGRLNSDGFIDPDKVDKFVLRLEQGASNMRQYSIQLEGKELSYPTFKMNKKGDLYGAAFFKHKRKTLIEGLLLVDIDASSGDLHQKPIALSKETFELAFDNGKKEKAFNPQRFSFRYFEADHLVFNKDGSMTIVAEQRPVINDYSQPLQNNDILALKLNPKKQLDWMVRIPKRQNAYDQGLSQLGYGLQSIQDTLFLFYNDDLRNHQKGRSQNTLQLFQPYDVEQPVAIMAKLYPDGHYLESILIPSKGIPQGVRMIPQQVWQRSERGMLIYCELTSGLNTFGLLYPLNPEGN